jgi:hypothetical protein
MGDTIIGVQFERARDCELEIRVQNAAAAGAGLYLLTDETVIAKILRPSSAVFESAPDGQFPSVAKSAWALATTEPNT